MKTLKINIEFTAAGLFYLAELIEEYSSAAKKTIIYMIGATTTIYVLFIFFDHLSWSMVFCGLGAQIFHGFIMKNFPYVKFISISFAGAVILLVINHYLAFQYFSTTYHSFSEVTTLSFDLKHVFYSFLFYRFWHISHYVSGVYRSPFL